jgi:phosphoglycerate dehydrogenase-like enzyme
LAKLVSDAQILAALLPLTDATRGLLSAALIDALPQGCLVVLSTRADICDMEALRRRVLRAELSLAADVFDVEPLLPDDPLLGLPHVVHTPHNAGRTRQANSAWAQALCEEFLPLS